MSSIPYAHAIVTGASSGIGAALTRRLATEGVKSFTLVARRKERLEALATALPVPAQVLVADLSTPTGLQQVVDAVGHTDLLVNNAGFASFGAFHALPSEREVDMVKLNCIAPVALTAHYLPQMVKNGHGAVLNIASGQSFQAMPYMSTYAATKAFLLHWAEGVRAELRGTGVRMVTVCPGSVPTEFNRAAKVPESELGVMSLVTGPLEDVISGAISGLSNNRGTVVPGFRNRFATAFGQMSPRSTSAWFLALVLRKAALRASARDESDPIAR